MAVEKFIHGKHDDAHHEGKRSEVRRLAEADHHLLDYLQGDAGEDLLREATKMVTGVQLAPFPHLTEDIEKI